MDIAEEVKQIRGMLKEYREAYYNLSPKVSDEKYDALKDRLAEIAPDDEEVVAVGAVAPQFSTFEKVEHIIPMGSLNKVNSEEEFMEFGNKMLAEGTKEFIISHKLDGSSLELIYEDSKLRKGVTRGDGKVGEDITVNIMQIPSIPHTLEKMIPGQIIVRGEVIMHKDVFQATYAKEYANPRNTSAGKLRDKKNAGVDCKNLEFYAFELEMNSKPDKEDMKFQALKKLGFQIPWYEVGSIDDMVTAFKHQEQIRDTIKYEIDGEVVSVNETAIQDVLGSHNLRPRFKMAWKFEAEVGVTQVEDIKWQVGPTGRVTPVAQVRPVKIGGVTITSISLHNIKMFKMLKLYEGCQVLVSRRNDVIPYIEENISLGIAVEAA